MIGIIACPVSPRETSPGIRIYPIEPTSCGYVVGDPQSGEWVKRRTHVLGNQMSRDIYKVYYPAVSGAQGTRAAYFGYLG